MTADPARRTRRMILLAFVLALSFTVYHAVRMFSTAIYWQQHRDEPIHRWMTIGFIGHCYHVSIRGLIASTFVTSWGVFPVQALGDIGAGLQSVAVSGLVARILTATDRVNVGQSAVMTVQGVGASLNPAAGELIAHGLGFDISFLILGVFSLVSVALWIAAAEIMKPACAGRPGRKTPELAAA